jgi:hypothetical protein
VISFGPSGGNRDENGYRFGVAAGVIGSSTVLPKIALALQEISRHPVDVDGITGLARCDVVAPRCASKSLLPADSVQCRSPRFHNPERGGWRWGVKKQGNGYAYGRATADCGNLRA